MSDWPEWKVYHRLQGTEIDVVLITKDMYNEAREAVLSREAMWEKYKHLDRLLSDEMWIGENIKMQILYDLWHAIRKK